MYAQLESNIWQFISIVTSFLFYRSIRIWIVMFTRFVFDLTSNKIIDNRHRYIILSIHIVMQILKRSVEFYHVANFKYLSEYLVNMYFGQLWFINFFLDIPVY